MPQIIVENLSKTYHVAQRQSGLLGAVRGLAQRRATAVHALRGVSCSLEAGEIVANHPDPLGSSLPFQWCSPLLGVAFLLVSLQAWKFAALLLDGELSPWERGHPGRLKAS
jgi:hypothetical protein